MKKYILLAILLPVLTVGQEDKKIKGNITSKDVNISILGVYQDDFPNVSVVFRAEKSNGNPVFGLKKKDMTVKENDENCSKYVVFTEGMDKYGEKWVERGYYILTDNEWSEMRKYQDIQFYLRANSETPKFHTSTE